MIIDFHIHSKYSYDSILEPRDILEAAKRKRLGGIAITDHDTICGGVEAKDINDDPNFLVIVGSEVNTEIGDVIGLFLVRDIKSRLSGEVIGEIKRQGGIVVLPHPYKRHDLNDDIINNVDLIETFNSRTACAYNDSAMKLASEYNKPCIAGSDAHFASEIGLAQTHIECQGIENIKSSMISKNNILTSCMYSPAYLQKASSLIKSIKMKKYTKIPLDSVKLVFYYFIGDKLKSIIERGRSGPCTNR
jgi:predicted metal-dependent phosphoesterase TrpH